MKENKYIINELSTYENPYNDSRAEKIQRYDFGKGAEGAVYIPEDINPDTKIMVYFSGQAEKASWYAKKGGLYSQNYLEMDCNDTIVIMVDVNNTNNIERTELAVEMIEKLKEEYNLTSTDIEYSGWSLGADSCLLTAKKYIENNPGAKPQVCVTIDGYASYAYNPNNMIPKIKDTFKENGTILIGLEAPWREKQNLDLYAKAGINVLRVIYKGDGKVDAIENGRYYTYENNRAHHSIVNQHFFKDNFSDFISGKSNLPSEGYIYQIYDDKEGKWIDIEASQINTYDKLNEFFGNDILKININKLKELNTIDITNLSVTSDSAILFNNINNILCNIKNSSFVQNDVSYSCSFSSTTKIPTSIPESVKSFYSATATLLLKISGEVQQFAKIGESFDKKDQELEQVALELNGTTTNGVSETSVNSVNKTQISTTQIDTNTINNTENKTQDDKKEEQPKPEASKKEENKNQEENQVPSETKEKAESIKETENLQEESDNKSEQSVINEETIKTEQTNNYNNYQNSQNNIKTNSVNNTTNQTNSPSNEQKNTIEYFPDFKEVYSDESRIVYNYKDDCRIIIHKNGNEITGIEHYYKFDNENIADKALGILTETYKTNNNIENIIQKGNYVKVIFKEEVYTNMPLNDIQNKYKDLKEIVK